MQLDAVGESTIPLPRDVLYPDDAAMLPEGSEVDGRTLTRAVREAFDYVVVGSGAAGATAAVVLAERGYRVAIVEEGRWVRTREFTARLWPAMKNMFRGHGTAITQGRAFLGLMQGCCVGGSTTINSAIAWRPPENVVARWQDEFGLGEEISMRALAPHFDVLEHDLNVRPVDDAALGGNNALLGVAADKLGYEAHRIQRYDAGCAGSASCSQGCPTGKKLGMNITFVPRALHAGARIFSSTLVKSVELQGGRAVGVLAEAKGAHGPIEVRLSARRGVFVAASAVQTPLVLRRSGLRSRAIGRHFQAHPGVSMMGRFDGPIAMDFGATQGANSLHFLEKEGIKLETLSLPPELAVARMPGFGSDLMRHLADYGHMAIWAVVIRAEAQGTVGEMFGETVVRYCPSEKDMARGRKGLKILAEMMFAVGAKELYPGAYGMTPVIRSVDEIGLFDSAPVDPRCYTMIVSHLFGAARMGRDPRTSAVGTDFQSHEAKGLYVVDSSVFPTNLGVNPQHTIMAMARLAATRASERPLALV